MSKPVVRHVLVTLGLSRRKPAKFHTSSAAAGVSAVGGSGVGRGSPSREWGDGTPERRRR